MQEEKTTFQSWCIVELFGHQKIAGNCSEKNIAGVNMLRVDVPETKNQPAFTRYFGGSAIYAINPCDENTAKIIAQELQPTAITTWNGSSFLEKYNALKALPDSQNELPY